MKKINTNRIIVFSFLLIFGIFTLLMLIFPVFSFSSFIYSKNITGFDLLSFNSNSLLTLFFGNLGKNISTVFTFISFAQLIIGICIIVKIILNFFSDKDYDSNFPIIYLGLTSMSLYTLEGIVCMLLYFKEKSDLDGFSTFSYWPLIVGAIILIGYHVVQNQIPNDSYFTDKEKSEDETIRQPISESDKIKLILEYKDLFDKGIITEEEFIQKKKELMK